MTKPSRIIKSAWHTARRPIPLKDFARKLASGDGPLAAAAKAWLKHKGLRVEGGAS